MYQALIWLRIGRLRIGGGRGDHSRRLATSLDPEDMKCLADALIDRVRGNSQPEDDLLRRKMPIDQQQAFALSSRKPGKSSSDLRCRVSQQ